MAKKVIFGILIILIAWVAYNKLRPRQNDYDYLMNLPATVSDLAEKRLGAEIRRLIAEDYKDQKGRTYQDLNGIITLHTMQKGEISIYPLETIVEIQGSKEHPNATLAFKAAMLRGPKQPGALDVLPASASVYAFKFYLEKTKDGWLVKSGDWNPVSNK